MAWLIQFKPRDTQRPWIHLAPAEGGVPFCREYQFAKAPVKAGVDLADAAATGERVCPKCFAELGDRRSEVVAEFEVAECLLSCEHDVSCSCMSGLRCAPFVDATALHWECAWLRVPHISVIRIGWTLWRYMPSRYIASGEVPCYGTGRGALFGGKQQGLW